MANEALKLTPIKRRIAVHVWEGLTNPQIAALEGKTPDAIKGHLREIFDRLGVWSRLELALYIAAHGGRKWAQL